jgi:hypothetical protein
MPSSGLAAFFLSCERVKGPAIDRFIAGWRLCADCVEKLDARGFRGRKWVILRKYLCSNPLILLGRCF